MSKFVLLIGLLVIVCVTAAGDNVEAGKSVSNSSAPLPISQSGSKTPDQSKSTSESQSVPVDAISSKDASSSKSNSQAEGKPDTPKSPPINASPESANPDEGMIHAPDPSGDLGRKLNPEALMRGFYVFVGLGVIVMAYIAWKSFGRRTATVHRYGVVANREDLEMAPLDSDEGEGEEDATTHFDISKHRLK